MPCRGGRQRKEKLQAWQTGEKKNKHGREEKRERKERQNLPCHGSAHLLLGERKREYDLLLVTKGEEREEQSLRRVCGGKERGGKARSFSLVIL